MDIITCLDERDGMTFAHRRQSRDRAVVRDVLARLDGRELWLAPYSAELFAGAENVRVSPNFLAEAPEDAVCFVEDAEVLPYEARIRRITIYRWHRHYPADRRFDLPLAACGWKCVAQVDFAGHSHDTITREDYER